MRVHQPCLEGYKRLQERETAWHSCQISGILSKLRDFTQKWSTTCITSKCTRCKHSTSCESRIWSLLLPKHKTCFVIASCLQGLALAM